MRNPTHFAASPSEVLAVQNQTPVPTPEKEQHLARFDQQLAPLRSEFNKSTPELDAEFAKWATSVDAASLPKDLVEISCDRRCQEKARRL